MLSAQAKTGVASQQIAQGLVQAIQAVGGNPTPSQAAMLGGLLAGYGQTAGLSPSQVAQVLTPLLQASRLQLTPGNLIGTMAGISGGLSAFPGSQAAAPMQTIASQVFQQAIGGSPNAPGTTALVNALGQTGGIYRNQSVVQGGLSGVSSGMQNAYGNPSQEAFLQMAGVGYWQQRAGLNSPQVAKQVMDEATKLYGTGITRDIALRSMFGMQGADVLEQLAGHPSTLNNAIKQAQSPQPATGRGSTSWMQGQIGHAQQRTTPGSRG